MALLFLWPLGLGAVPFGLLAWGAGPRLPLGGLRMYHGGVITLAAGSCMAGIFEIYGTASEWVAVYWLVGGFLLLGASLRMVYWIRRERKEGSRG